MKCIALTAGALMLIVTLGVGDSYAVEPVKARPAVQVQTATGTPVTDVGWRRYGPGYRYNSYYGPRYGYYGYYGPGYRTNSYYGADNYGGHYYGPSYYRGPAHRVNVYPGGVDVGGAHVRW